MHLTRFRLVEKQSATVITHTTHYREPVPLNRLETLLNDVDNEQSDDSEIDDYEEQSFEALFIPDDAVECVAVR